MDIKDLWTATCSGDIYILKEYFENGGEINKKYFKFGNEHSLIMGAFRNNQFNTVEYLESIGETILPYEKLEYICLKQKGKIYMDRQYLRTTLEGLHPEASVRLYKDETSSSFCNTKVMDLLVRKNEILNDFGFEYDNTFVMNITIHFGRDISLVIKSVEDYYKEKGE